MPEPLTTASFLNKLKTMGSEIIGLKGAEPQPLAVAAGRIVRGALVLLGLIFFALTVYGGVLYLTAGGNEEQVKKATGILKGAIIGLIIVIFAGAITQFITGYIARPVVTP